jgi:polysaccharide export outer membrane protein
MLKLLCNSLISTVLLGSLATAADAQSAGAGHRGAALPIDTIGLGTTGSAANARGSFVATSQGALLDLPISRSEYRLGPGDLLTLSIFGDRSDILSLRVTPEGSLVVPSIGIAPVVGLNIDQAQERVRDLVYRYYRNVDIQLSLEQVRTFKVFVVGSAVGPGVRAASAVTRVSEVLSTADTAGVVRRNVTVRRASGENVLVDLARFLYTGDLSHNPRLRDGDVLVVPSVDRTVQIAGRVAYPGVYEHRPDESLAAFLEIVTGGNGFPANAADSIRISRFNGGQIREFHTFSRADATGELGRAFTLRPFDAIFVPEIANFMRHQSVTLRGQVHRPGPYPISPDSTTLLEVIRAAGGFTARASLADGVLQRRSPVLPNNELDRLRALPAEYLSVDDQRLLKASTQVDEAHVVIDFAELSVDGGDALDQTLRNGDVIWIPERRNEVLVMGAVARPGIVQYVPGETVEDYVERAGGYTRRSDRDDLTVLRAREGTRLSRKDVTYLEPGDRVIVPFREPQTFVQRMQTVQSVVSTVSGLVVTIIGLERLVDNF